MKIAEKDIRKVANLARLVLNDAEVHSMTEQVGKILSYVEKLNELNTDGIEPTTHAIQVNNAFRDDEVCRSLPQAEALRNGPLQNGEAFVVPKVI
nr:Asp-tRNA(Asn)/Glu-tRNA(Gln) amidotransferase subunit GatC [Desulfobulbaceae bacterium]